ncbi:ribose-phosphate diphosphokinase [Sphingomonas sp.]|uniref:ribose-phosphate diphosphokinase n=1 Tax=Sphingomonas sp. TaxID=28214 RepID=UPI00286C2F5C|nr:ribose-phosphate diphosphokinase [Sphingomonas sp.]
MARFFAMPGNGDLTDEISVLTASETGTIEYRRFPDSESYVRIHGDVRKGDTFLVCTLAHPDEHFVPLVFAARALRAAGARSISLIAPYLAYMRQDRAFAANEAVSSRIFADLISREFDRLITVDPHLHRIASLQEIYSIPTTVVHTSGLIGRWVRDHVASPIILGPDIESAQWAKNIARNASCPWAVFRKERRGDREVQLIPPSLDQHAMRTPVLVDDIISSGATMIQAAMILMAADMLPPYCIAVHALCDERTAAEIEGLAQSLLTSDSIPNPHSAFSVAPLIAEQLAGVTT